MGSGIPAHNIYNGYHQPPEPYLLQTAILPDPDTGGLYGSTVPMQDSPRIAHSWQEVPYAPRIVTHGSLLGDVAAIAVGPGV